MNKVIWIISMFGLNFGVVAQESGPVTFADEPPANLKLFLLVGQSNMAGRGIVEPEDKKPIAGVWMLGPNYKWIPAVDPMHFDRETAGVGMGRSFAAALIKDCSDLQIGLIPCAFGGTSLEMWQPKKHLFRNAVYRTQFAQEYGELTGILWHQGESDASSETASKSYGERLAIMIDSLRAGLDAPDVPVIVGTLGDFVKFRKDGIKKFAPEINQHILTFESAERNIGVVDTAGLEHGGDFLHFSSSALRRMGQLYALKFQLLDPDFCQPRYFTN